MKKNITLTKAQTIVIDNLSELIKQVRPLNTSEILKLEVELNQIRVITNSELGALKRTLNALESKGLVVINGIEVELTTAGKDYINRKQQRKAKTVEQDKPLTALQKSMIDIIKRIVINNEQFNLNHIHEIRCEFEGNHGNSRPKYHGTETAVKNLIKLGYIKKVENQIDSDLTELWGDDILELTEKGKTYLEK